VFSPGAWSRGHGWLLRGLVDGARVLPPGDLREALREVIAEVVAALLPLQDEAGCWRALLTRPSAPEISGTALIAGALARAAHAGLVPAEPALVAAQRALPTVLAQIDAAGVVHGVCPGPGPLSTEEPWLAPSFLPDDPHGPLAVLDLAAALLP
jgi:rhamnogalacturonyl hydrolase YesR